MSREYLTRREFNKRAILGGTLGLIGIVDMSYTDSKLDQLNNEAKNEVIEQGITPPNPVDVKQYPKEAKAKQDRFDKAAEERLNQKENLNLIRLRSFGDSAAVVGGLIVVFNAMFRKRPSWGPDMERKK